MRKQAGKLSRSLTLCGFTPSWLPATYSCLHYRAGCTWVSVTNWMEDAYGEIGHRLRSAGHVGNNSYAGNHVNLQRPSERPVALWLYLHSPELNEAARRRRQRPLPPPPRPPSFPVSATSHGGKESQNGVLSVVASVRPHPSARSTRLCCRGWLCGRWQTKTSFAQSRMNDGMRQ